MNIITTAKYVIDYAINKSSPISNLQLQKILYFLDGEYWAAKRSFLFEEGFKAYPLGPLNEDVYRIYKGYGSSKIFDKSNVSLDVEVDAKVVNAILDNLVEVSAFNLVERAHELGKAWDRTVKNDGMYSEITKKLMKEEFAHE